MIHDKSKAVALMALGLAGILIAYTAGITLNSATLFPLVGKTLTQQKEAKELLLQSVIFGIGGGCMLLCWGSVKLDRTMRRQLEDQAAAKRRERREVAA